MLKGCPNMTRDSNEMKIRMLMRHKHIKKDAKNDAKGDKTRYTVRCKNTLVHPFPQFQHRMTPN